MITVEVNGFHRKVYIEKDNVKIPLHFEAITQIFKTIKSIGDRKMIVNLYDNNGQNIVDTTAFWIDLTEPVVTDVSPNNGAMINYPISSITSTLNDGIGIGTDMIESSISLITPYDIVLNDGDTCPWFENGEIEVETNDSTFTLNFPNLPYDTEHSQDGEFIIRTTSIDSLGNTAIVDSTFLYDTWTAIVDSTYPENGIEILEESGDGFTLIAYMHDRIPPSGDYPSGLNLSATTIELYQIVEDELVGPLGGSYIALDDSITSINFSLDGRYIVLNGPDNIAKILNVADGKEIIRLLHDNHVISVAFSLDGHYIVSASVDKTIRIWRVSDGKETTRIPQNDSVYSVAFSSDGRYVVSRGCTRTDDLGNCEESMARVWNTRSGKEISHFEEDIKAVTYHDLQIKKENKIWEAVVLFDI